MPMIPFLQRYLTKKAPFHITLLVIFLVVSTLLVNIFLAQEKDVLSRNLDLCIPGKASIHSIFYIFPNKFYITGIKIRDHSKAQDPLVLDIPALTLNLSIKDMLSRQTVIISGAQVIKPVIQQEAFLEYIDTYKQQIKNLLASLPQGRFGLVINQGILERPLSSSDGKRKTFYVNLSLAGKNWLIKGWLREDLYRRSKHFFNPRKTKIQIASKGLPFTFSSEGLWEGRFIILDHIEAKMKDFHCRLWGMFDDDIIKLEGYVLSKMNIQTRLKDKGPFRISDIPSFLQSKIATPTWRPNIFILDIRLVCRLLLPKIKVERLSFLLNNAPVCARGQITLDRGLLWDGHISFAPALEQRQRSGNFQGAEFVLKSYWYKNVLRNKGRLIFHYEKNDNSGIPLRQLEVSVGDLWLNNVNPYEIEIEMYNSKLLFTTGKDDHLIKLDYLKALWVKRTQNMKFVKLYSPFYGGQLRGRVWVDTRQVPFKVHSVLDLKNVNTQILDSFLIYFAKVYGRLNGRIDISDSPSFKIKGDFLIQKGRLSNMSFFVWLADTFRLPALRDVPFDDLSADFYVDVTGQGLDNIDIISKDVALNGNFYVNPKRLVNSKISMSFSRELLTQSPKFSALLKRFDASTQSLLFDFQMSGNQDALNFKWLQNAAKDRIQEIIPDFIERKIERGIDSLLEPTEPKEPIQEGK